MNNSMDPIEAIRNKIDETDYQLLKILSHRMSLVKQLSEEKKKVNKGVYQPERWKNIMQTRSTQAQSMGLTKELAEKIFYIIHQEAIKLQSKNK